jgi:transposase
MLTISSTTKIFLCMTPIDMRRSFDSLAGIVQDAMGHDSFSGDFFVFRNREETKIKILYWDRDGYAIWYKRLEKGSFKLPVAAAGFQVEAAEFMMLLSGVEPTSIKRQDRYSRKSAFSGLSV